MKIVPYLNFDGNCKQAFVHYHEIFGGEPPQLFTHNDVPMEGLTDDWKDKILHARLDIDDQTIMGGDAPPDMYENPRSISVSIHSANLEEAEALFNALSADGTITMPWGEQPWGAVFGMCVDRFGIPWMVNCEQTS